METLSFETSTYEPLMLSTPSEEQKLSALNELDNQMTKAVLPVSILVAIGTVVGFFGNAIVIYVYTFHYKHCTFQVFILCLALVDILSTMITMPGEVVTQMYWYTYPSAVVCKVKSVSNLFTVAAEAMLLLAITFDRYLKACRPFGRQISIKTAKFTVIAIFLVSVVFAVPVAFFWGIHTANVKYKNVEITVTVCERDQRFVNKTDQVNYTFSMQGILCFIMAAMCVLCLLIARTLIARSKPIAQNATSLQVPARRVIQVTKKGNRNLQIEGAKSVHADTSTDITQDSDCQSDSTSNNRMEFLTWKKVADEDMSTNSANISSTLDATENVKSPVPRKEERYKKRAEMIKITPKVKRIRRVRSRTVIMFMITLTFIATTVLYLALVSYISKGILEKLTDAQKSIYFFFLRLYFINHVINPIIYGALDQRFQAVVTACWQTKIRGFF